MSGDKVMRIQTNLIEIQMAATTLRAFFIPFSSYI